MTSATRAPVTVFVAADGNQFMGDIAAWLEASVAECGHPVSVVSHRLPRVDGTINLVVAPHEFFALFDAPTTDLQRAAAASVCVCTEQPTTTWFRLGLDACRRGLLALDINPHGVEALAAAGVDAHLLRLGATPTLTAPTAAIRDIDVLVMAGLTERRGAALAELAPEMWRYGAELKLFAFDRPITASTPGVVFGTDKYALLQRSKVLLNLHRDDRDLPYFEWIRIVEAMANGCVVLSEPSAGFDPLAPGIHLVEAELDGIGDALLGLLADDQQRASIADAARLAVTQALPATATLAPLLRMMEERVLPNLAHHVRSSHPTRGPWRIPPVDVKHPVRLPTFRPYLSFQREARRLALAESAALRELDGVACLLRHGAAQHVDRHVTPSYEQCVPEVSVVLSLYNYADVVTEALDSIAASTAVTFEVIVVEDHATDASRDVTLRFMSEHPEVPMLLLAKEVNEGLAAARNDGFAAARAPLVMVMDADNAVYPPCLRRLADALHGDPEADAAYAMLEEFGTTRGLRSALAWDPERLCAANYIDAHSMIRRAAWLRLGGYRTDDTIHGWEDWDLWLRLAADGGYARLVPQVLSRYRVQAGSMVALSNLAADDAVRALRHRYPLLPWPPMPDLH